MASADRIKFRCPKCRRVCRVPATLAGAAGRCPGCKQALEVPGGSQSGISEEEEAFEIASDSDLEPVEVPEAQSKGKRDATASTEEDPADGKLALPPLIRVYGILIVASNGLGFLAVALRAMQGLQKGAGPVFLAIHAAGLVAGLVFVRLGLGLLKREWSAVQGLIVMGSLGVIFSLALMPNAPLVGGIVLTAVALLYGVPVRVAWLNKDAFEGVPDEDDESATGSGQKDEAGSEPGD